MSAKRPKVQLSKPSALHVYREYVGNVQRLVFGCPPEGLPKSVTQYREYLGEYAPRGPVVAERWEVRHANGPTTICNSRHQARKAHRSLGCDHCRIVHITTRKVCR